MSLRPSSERGSVLLPVVVALVILSAAGAALTELFAAQRLAGVGAIDSARAYWAGEAGLWHASLASDSISTPVDFAGAKYTVAVSGDSYTASVAINEAATAVEGELEGWTATVKGVEPLDVELSAASAYQHEDGHCHLSLVNVSGGDLVVNSVSLSASKGMPELVAFKLGGLDIWSDADGESLPASALRVTNGSTSERTIAADTAPDGYVEFKSDVSVSDVTLTLTLSFTDGRTSTIPFSAGW